MYWERQRGDLCRLHSLNAYFGYQRLTENAFFSYCNDYDSIIPGLNSRSMDGFSEGRCIINYIIDILDNVYTLTIPIDSYSNSREYINYERYKKILSNLDCYFEFNKGHVWFNKKKDNTWHKIDSITGITQIDPRLNKNGYILVFNIKQTLKEMNYYRQCIHTYSTFEQNELFLCNLFHASKHIAGNEKFNKIKDILYNFLKHYRKNNYKSYDYFLEKIIDLLK